MKRFKKSIILVLLIGLSIVLGGLVNVKAIDMELVYDLDGQPVKYYRTDTNVLIPKDYITPERDFRAAWVTPLTGDITGFNSEGQFKAEMTSVFQTLEYFNMNAIVYHVRIMNDALYPSVYNPFSKYYNADSDFDALEWLIDESHRRGIEFHAWMNPYRISSTETGRTKEEIAASYQGNNAASNPDNLLIGSGGEILNPGEPAVRQFLLDTARELLNNYDIDAIHFDDYFYISGIDDSTTRAKYNPNNLSMEDWRREQVNIFIKDLNNLIDNYNSLNKKAVQLGISPSGIWRNGDGVVTYDENNNAITNGSSTSGFAHYGNYLYSDTLKWANEGWIDYLVPQSYWSFDHNTARFADVMDWWDKALRYKDVNVYSGMGLYMSDNKTANKSWSYQPDVEAERQVRYISKLDKITGTVVFDYQQLAASKSSIGRMNQVMSNAWYQKALPTEVSSLGVNMITPDEVTNLNISKTLQGFKIQFNEANDANRYAIYRSSGDLTYAPEQLIDLIGNYSQDGVISYIDQEVKTGNYNYGVKALSRSNTLSNPVAINTSGALDGELLELEPIKNIIITDNLFKGENIKIRFDAIYSIYGDIVEYEVFYSTDLVTWNSMKNEGFPLTPSNVQLTQEFTIGDYDKFYLKIKAYTDIASTESDVIEINTTLDYGKINGLTYFEIPFRNTEITLQWKAKDIEGLTYKVQYSSNNYQWTDMDLSNSPIFYQNDYLKKKYIIPNDYSIIYIRVIGYDDFGIAFSDVLEIETKEYIQFPEEFFINNLPSNQNIMVFEGDEIIISWESMPEGTSYLVSWSSDGLNYNSLRNYDSTYQSEIGIDTTSFKITASYLYYKVYFKIHALYGNSNIELGTFEVYTTPYFHYLPSFISYMFNQNLNMLRKINK
ncbi:MAG: family 10 glycosylhydrolase [Bacilli bacterium]|jgi:uncharacterized lipoprotein YddW (UPF0748 family)|nr:family 10 glycosylhydrolase [Bacilli bacterium]MDD3121564.1 family 10 glycosylhydrolase [Bacilli bacterium]MDD4482210.1 family 10 glycosylhydrolase [Bacilli bacterium]MDY0363377.1 family 10 glycosylhydrolase [Bacilli bacterium]